MFWENQDENFNKELCKVSEWLKVNKLSLNIGKNMVFSVRNKNITILNFFMDGVKISRVMNFNLLGIMIDDQLNWKINSDLLSRKKSNYILPINIRLMIYNSLISSYFNYGFLCGVIITID